MSAMTTRAGKLATPGVVAALAAACVVAAMTLSACQTEPTTLQTPVECEPWEPLAADRLTVDAAREAHRWAELRRHVRFNEAVAPGYLLQRTAGVVAQERIDAGQVCFRTLYEAGRLIFEHEYSFADGLGDGESRDAASPFLRVHTGRYGGPETTSCTSCHWRGGVAGAGALQDNSFIQGDGDLVTSADARNPPPLHGAGVVQALAREMSQELGQIRDQLVRRARDERRAVEGRLVAKGVDFGVLRVSASGGIDSTGIEGIDPDLVIRPFGWKGTVATLREFVIESLQVHFGIQSEDLVARHRREPDPELVGPGTDPDDPDNDGKTAELTAGQLTALISFLAVQELPENRTPDRMRDPVTGILVDFPAEWTKGQDLFQSVGCVSCHRTMMVLEDPIFRTTSEVTGKTIEIDLSAQAEQPRLVYDPELGGYPVWLFSDLKRHDMGPRNASRHEDHGVSRRHYLTRRLWGLAHSAPYFHDGRAATFDHAIAAHDGEAAFARDAFAALSAADQSSLRVYLMSLRRARRPVVP